MEIFLILFLVLSTHFSIYSQSKFNLEANLGAILLHKQIKIYSDEPSHEADGLLPNLEKKVYFVIQSIGSYNFNKYFSLGIGTEFNRFENDFNLISFVSNAKLIYSSHLIKPFINLSLGYGIITTKEDNSGGLQYEGGIGIYYLLNKKIDLLLRGNYKVMYTESAPHTFTVGLPFKYPKIRNEFISLSVGINFKL